MSYQTDRLAAASPSSEAERAPPVWMPSFAARLASQKGQAAEVGGAVTGSTERGRSTIQGAIVGHASPRWRHPRDQNKDDLNLSLSRDRALEVEALLDTLLRDALGERASIDLQACGAQGDVPRDARLADVHVDGVGDDTTLGELGGDEDADDPSMRRVDVELLVTHDFDGEAGASLDVSEAFVEPAQCMSLASRRWAVKLAVSGGAGHGGVGAAFAIGELRNLVTGEVESGTFVGGGLGVGLQSPGGDPGWGDWSTFETERPCTFADFHGTRARLTMAGAGIAVIGGSLTWLSFPRLGVQSIPLHGGNMGAVGADMSTNVGIWQLESVPAGERCIPEREVIAEAMQTAAVPYERVETTSYRITLHFDTGSATLPEAELDRLRRFVTDVAAGWVDER